jgi:hypothetical protein
MAEQIIVQYVGFTPGALVREYRDHRKRSIRIPSGAVSGWTQYLFAETPSRNANDPSTTQFCITDSELADYNDDSSPKPVRYFQKQEQD